MDTLNTNVSNNVLITIITAPPVKLKPTVFSVCEKTMIWGKKYLPKRQGCRRTAKGTEIQQCKCSGVEDLINYGVDQWAGCSCVLEQDTEPQKCFSEALFGVSMEMKRYCQFFLIYK